jgi:hypothetical protein
MDTTFERDPLSGVAVFVAAARAGTFTERRQIAWG